MNTNYPSLLTTAMALGANTPNMNSRSDVPTSKPQSEEVKYRLEKAKRERKRLKRMKLNGKI